MSNKFLSMLGLAQRAGKLTSGEDKVLEAIQKGKAQLVIVAKDASHNTIKKFSDKCKFYKVPIMVNFERETLGRATGRMERVLIAVMDKGFAEALAKRAEPHDSGGPEPFGGEGY